LNGNLRVSVIVPTHDRPDMLAKALDSVFGQTCLPEEVVVINDASSESYSKVVKKLKPPSGLDLIYHRLESPLGGSGARNYGAKLARGDMLMFLDDDDTWLPNKVENQLHILEKRPEVGLVYSGRKVVDENGNHLYTVVPQLEGWIHKDLLKSNHIGITSAVAVRKEIFWKAGGFDLMLPARQDYDLWIRITALTAVAVDPEPTVCWLVHSQAGRQISSRPKKYEKAVEYLLKKYGNEYALLSPVERRKAYAAQHIILADKFAQAGSRRKYLHALRAVTYYPSVSAVSRMLPRSIWLKLRGIYNR